MANRKRRVTKDEQNLIDTLAMVAALGVYSEDPRLSKPVPETGSRRSYLSSVPGSNTNWERKRMLAHAMARADSIARAKREAGRGGLVKFPLQGSLYDSLAGYNRNLADYFRAQVGK